MGKTPFAAAMNDQYDTDILLWSERQAELLRRRTAGEMVNVAQPLRAEVA
jgi:hypothetical protein